MSNATDGFQPKYRIFHPQTTVWIQNPFDHDVTFNVADERNNPYTYTMPSMKTSELPGGAVATLGVKAIVDEMIQNDPKDVFSMWEKGVREKYENKIILRVKEAPQATIEQRTGSINLATTTDVTEEENNPVVEIEKPVFPTKASKTEPKRDYANVGSKADVVIEE